MGQSLGKEIFDEYTRESSVQFDHVGLHQLYQHKRMSNRLLIDRSFVSTRFNCNSSDIDILSTRASRLPKSFYSCRFTRYEEV